MSLWNESFQYSVCAKAVSLVPCNCTYLSKILKCEFKYMRKLLEITGSAWVLAVQHCLVQMLTQDFGTNTDWNLGRFWCVYRLNLLAAVSIFQNLGAFFPSLKSFEL